MEYNHDPKNCQGCAWNKGRSMKSCEVFKDKRNVILNEAGQCNGLADAEKRLRIERACKAYRKYYNYGKEMEEM